MDIRFSCHVCGQHIVAAEETVGQAVSCPNCSQLLTVPSDSSLPPAPELRPLPPFLLKLEPKARHLALDKPPCWEHLLFFQVWADEIDKCANPMLEDKSGASPVAAEHVDKRAAVQWLRKRADDFTGLLETLDKLVKISAPESFGPPGQAGNVEKIISVATTLARVVSSMLQWVERVRQASIDEPFTVVGFELANMAIPVIERVRRFPHKSLSEVQKAIADENRTGKLIKLSLVLDVGGMDSGAYIAALHDAERLSMQMMYPEIYDTWGTTSKGVRTALRRQERGARKHQRELERQAKEQAKLSAIEQARLEVETYENSVEMLLSIHKEQGQTWDWIKLAVLPTPLSPGKLSCHELRAKQYLAVSPSEQDQEATIQQAQERDEQEYQESLRRFAEEKSEWKRTTDLACRILSGEHAAYIKALVELSPFDEVANLGSSIDFTVHSTELMECVLTIHGRQAIPSEVKSLTTTGKVSIKPMAKRRFHEIYQDYVCGCVLRVAREVFALLPIECVLVTASAERLDMHTGHTVEQPVLSAIISRDKIAGLDFDRLDPSDAMANFPHRGDFKKSRESEEFESITPLTSGDVPPQSPEKLELHSVVASAAQLREELKTMIAEFNPSAAAGVSEGKAIL